MDKVKELIDKKILEHRQATVEAQSKLEEVQKKLQNGPPDLTELSKVKVLMDKNLFHQGAMRALEDLKEEL